MKIKLKQTAGVFITIISNETRAIAVVMVRRRGGCNVMLAGGEETNQESLFKTKSPFITILLEPARNYLALDVLPGVEDTRNYGKQLPIWRTRSKLYFFLFFNM